MEDWVVWHEQYAQPGSGLSRRLAFVQANIRDFLNSTPGCAPADLRSWFTENGCAEESFTAPRDNQYSVGRHRFIGEPLRLVPGQHIFTFTR